MSKFEICCECLVFFCACFGLLKHSRLLSGNPRQDFFMYYTNQSNLLVVLFFAARLILRIFGKTDSWIFSSFLYYAVTMSIVLTFAVFHFVLRPSLQKAPEGNSGKELLSSLSNKFVHYIVPLFTLFCWCFFAEKSTLSVWFAVFWVVFPLAYMVFSILHAAGGRNLYNTDSPYPYFFMDPNKISKAKIVRYYIIILSASIGMGLLFIGLAKILTRG